MKTENPERIGSGPEDGVGNAGRTKEWTRDGITLNVKPDGHEEYACTAGTTGVFQRLAALWRADFCSPKDFARRALTLAAIYLAVHLAGLREFTSVLTGTSGSLAISRGMASFLGLCYVFSYLGFVLAAPMLLIAAALIAGTRKIITSRIQR